MEQRSLCGELETIDRSIPFLIAIIAGTLLALQGVLLQREGVCDQICGREPDLSALFPVRHTGSGLIVGALAFFLCQSARTATAADPCDPVAVCSGRSNLLAAVLVFLAAAIRYDDVLFLRANGRI